MIDIQSTPDTREVPLQKVGVKNVRYPLQVLDKNRKTQSTTATINLFVNLPHNFKGTHMSRFIEVFHKYHNDISMNNFLEMLEEIRTKLQAERAFGRITFPYFIEKHAPVSQSAGLMEYTCSYEGEVTVRSEGLEVRSSKGESLPLAPIPLTTQEKSEQALPSPLRSGISATPSAGTPASLHSKLDFNAPSGILFSVRQSDLPELPALAKKFYDLGFKLYATSGNAATIERSDMEVEYVAKVHENYNDNVMTLLESGKVVYVVSTSAKGRDPVAESVKLRRLAVERDIDCLTAIDTANALADCLASPYSLENASLVDINHNL